MSTEDILDDVLRVSDEDVSAARALIHLRGGDDKVDPIIARIANAEPDLVPTARSES